MTKNTNRISEIQVKLDHVQREIKDINSYLTSTTSPAETMIAELNMLKEVESFYKQALKNANDST
jgi:hypothetical protein